MPEQNPTKGEARLGFCGGQAATAAQRIAYVEVVEKVFVSPKESMI
ncbi:hypothetical protein AGMMS50268_39720 [Spirochaetia bacterium]|nr:hypothetical protein AGMMS50268_39720 [Spirochaetia bacterium]